MNLLEVYQRLKNKISELLTFSFTDTVTTLRCSRPSPSFPSSNAGDFLVNGQRQRHRLRRGEHRRGVRTPRRRLLRQVRPVLRGEAA